MKVSGSLPAMGNSVLNVGLEVYNPTSGFEFSIMETGIGSADDLIMFSGVSGYLFDQSGHFFGGYRSGIPFDITIHFDKANTSFKYYSEDVLIANNMASYASHSDQTINHVEFQKYDNSFLSISASGERL